MQLRVRRRKAEQGASLVETAVVLPLFILLMAGTIDVGLALTQYFTLARTAYEGIRLASHTPQLELAEYGDGVQDPPPQTAHFILQNKIQALVNNQERKLPQNVGITTSRANDVPKQSGGTVDNVVRVELSMPYNSIFPLFQNYTLRASLSSSYLYKQDT